MSLLRAALTLPVLSLTLAAAPGSRVDALFARQRHLAKGRSTALFGVFQKPLTTEERADLRFLYAGMPLNDLATFDGPFFLEAVRASHQARQAVPWGAAIPEEVFRHFVLPLRVNNENLDAFRVRTWRELVDRVKGLAPRQAALEINHWCHEHVTYQGSDERTSAPLATLRTGTGRCGEESTFTVSALRAACIPARQVYTPRWAHCDDNHAWVEVWVDGGWHYLGACEPEADLDLGWFREPARRTVLVHTRAYGPYEGSEPVVNATPGYAELNVTAHYAPVHAVPVEISDRQGRPVPGATVEYRLYNYAEFFPLAAVTTDARGRASLDLGLGDILVWAHKGRAFGFRKITVGKEVPVRITLDADPTQARTLDLDQVPPVAPPPLPDPVPPAAREANNARLKAEDALRARHLATFLDPAGAEALGRELGLDPAAVAKEIHRSAGNWEEIQAFLRGADARTRPFALPLLGTLSDKDLRDTPAAVLRDHLEHALPATADPDFVACVLAPRVANELLTPFRAYLQTHLPAPLAAQGRKDPARIAAWTRAHIRLADAANPTKVPLGPQGVLELGVADAHSRDIFFVAACRSLGIPARLEPALGTPQFKVGGAWKDAALAGPAHPQGPLGRLRLRGEGADLAYWTQATLARFENGTYLTLNLDEGLSLSRLGVLDLPAGPYLAVTGNREAGGTVRARLAFFDLKAGADLDLALVQRAAAPGAVYGPVDPSATLREGDHVQSLKTVCQGRGAVLIWTAPGQEPTRHVMAELQDHRPALEAWGGPVAFLLPAGQDVGADFKGLPARGILAQDPGDALLKAVAQAQKRPLGAARPVIAVLDPSGRLVYAAEGYQIGVWDQILKSIHAFQ